MQWFKDFIKRSGKSAKNNHYKNDDFHTPINQSWTKCMRSMQKKLSCGSTQIARILKTRTHFGNREYLNNKRRDF